MASGKTNMMDTAKDLVRKSLRLRYSGAHPAEAARAQGYADGYMRMMLDANVATQRELLAMVVAERTRISGPATAVVAADALA